MSKLVKAPVKMGRKPYAPEIKRKVVWASVGAQTFRDLKAFHNQHLALNPKTNLGRTLDILVKHLVEAKFNIR